MQQFDISEKNEMIANSSFIFLKYGLKSSSMDDLAARMKISKKSIYKYFKNKTDLVKSVLEYRENKVMQQWEQFTTSNFDMLELAHAKRQIFPKLFLEETRSNYFDVKKYYPELYREFLENRGKNFQMQMEKFVTLGIEQGLFRTDYDIKFKNLIFAKVLKQLSVPSDQDFTEYTISDVISEIFDTYIRSIVTEKGAKRWNTLCKENPSTEVFNSIFNYQKQ